MTGICLPRLDLVGDISLTCLSFWASEKWLFAIFWEPWSGHVQSPPSWSVFNENSLQTGLKLVVVVLLSLERLINSTVRPRLRNGVCEGTSECLWKSSKRKKKKKSLVISVSSVLGMCFWAPPRVSDRSELTAAVVASTEKHVLPCVGYPCHWTFYLCDFCCYCCFPFVCSLIQGFSL